MNVFLHFYKRIFVANFSIAFIFSTFAYSAPDLALRVFVISFPTFAYGLTLFFFERYKYQYYMYRNLGYKKTRLILFGFFTKGIIALLMYTVFSFLL
jgi:hypothetical protein